MVRIVAVRGVHISARNVVQPNLLYHLIPSEFFKVQKLSVGFLGVNSDLGILFGIARSLRNFFGYRFIPPFTRHHHFKII